MNRRPMRQGISFAVLSFAITALLAVVTSIVMARLYGIRVVGETALALAPMGVLGLLSTVQEQPALIRRIAALPPRDPRITGMFAAVFSFSLMLTLLVSLLVAGATVLIFDNVIHRSELVLPAFGYLAANVFLVNPAWNFDAVFAAYGDGRSLFWLRLGQAATNLVLLVACSGQLRTVWGPLVAFAGSFAVALVHRLLVVNVWMARSLSVEEWRRGLGQLREIVLFGLKSAPGAVATGIRDETGTWSLGILGSLSSLAAYNRATTISRRLMEISWRIGEMVFPALVDHHARNDKPAFDRTFAQGVRLSSIPLLALAASVGGCATGVMNLFGRGFAAGSWALALTILVPLAATVTALQLAALLAVGKPGTTSRVGLTGMLVTLIVGVALTRPLGATGPAVGLLAGAGAAAIAGALAVRRKAHIQLAQHWPRAHQLSLLVAYAVAFGTGRAIDAALTGVAGLLIGGGASLAAYAAVLLATGAITREDRDLVRRLLSQGRANLGRRSDRAATADV